MCSPGLETMGGKWWVMGAGWWVALMLVGIGCSSHVITKLKTK